MKLQHLKSLLLVLLTLSPFSVTAQTIEIDGILYKLAGNEAQVVSKAAKYSGDIIIPSSINHKDNVYTITSIGDYAFEYCTSLTSISFPSCLGSIGISAFRNCSSLRNIDIPNNVTTIGDKAFFNCNHLTNVTFGNSITTIGDKAFEYCSSLESITIPDGVISIGKNAFEYCRGLTSIEIPNSIKRIGEEAFYGCNSLSCIKLAIAEPPTITPGTFSFTIFHDATLYVPLGSADHYKAKAEWKNFQDIRE